MGVGTGQYMYNVVVKKFTFAISSPGEFLSIKGPHLTWSNWKNTSVKKKQQK